MTPDQTLIEQVTRKVACGLRQITASIGENTLFADREVQEWQDRINGFAAELEATLQGSAALPSEAITPEMIEAGMLASDNALTMRNDVLSRVVVAIYTAMRATTPTAPNVDG